MRIVIIGAVAGGATVAARLRRLDEKSEIILLEKGEFISFANCGLPYYVGGEIVSVDKLLLHSPESLGSRFNLDIRVKSEAIQILNEKNEIVVKDLEKNSEYVLSYDQLILSTGAIPFIPKIEGIENEGIFSVRTIPDVVKIKEYIKENNVQSVAVIGGGYIGLEIIEQLHKLNLDLHLVESLPQVLATFDLEMAKVVEQELIKHKIKIHLSNPLAAIEKTNNKLIATLKNKETINVDMIIMAIGVRPENTLAKNAGLNIGVTGGIVVNEYLQTSKNNIWAIGDCIEVDDYITKQKAVIALAGPANRQARIVADNIYGSNKKYNGTLGTAVLRCFDLTLASTGASEARLIKSNIPFLKIHLHPMNHVGYYPGATPINLKVLFDANGKILGAQAIGKNGVEKRIDVLATAIKGDLSVTDLIDIELSYAPPYGSAKDPINLAGMIAENILTKKVDYIYSDELRDDTYLLDVREDSEVANGIIKKAVHIPLNTLRSRLDELPRDREIIVYCHSGQRSYFANRILLQNGFKVKNLSGAYKTFIGN